MDAKSGSERLLFLYLNRLKHLNKEHGYNYPVLFNDKSRNDIGNNEKAALTLIESRIPVTISTTIEDQVLHLKDVLTIT